MRRSAHLVPMLVALAMLATSAPLSQDAEGEPAPEPVWVISGRPVVVTDAHCGADGVKKEHRRCALERASEGFDLIFYEPGRAELYTVEYSSEEVRFQVLNDFAGLPAFAQGLWDDDNHVLKLDAIHPLREHKGSTMFLEEAP